MPSLLARCVVKGLPFRISVDSPEFVDCATSQLTSVDTSNTCIIPQGQGELLSWQMVNQYYNNVQAVLSRLHACHFLSRGGLIWRIIQQYAPQLYTSALIGPTAEDRHLVVDEHGYAPAAIMANEVEMLLGVTSNNNSFWPYPEWYEGSSHYNGEWTAVNEAWFVRQADSIAQCKPGCLRAGRAWQKTIHIYTNVAISNPETEGTSAHAKSVCLHLVKEWLELWDGFDFKRLSDGS
jgi:hypothetical protein